MRVVAYVNTKARQELQSTPGVEVLGFKPDTETFGHLTLDVEPEAVVFLQYLTEQRDSGVRKVTRKDGQ